MYEYNKGLVAQANAEGIRMDLALYGDSITRLLLTDYKEARGCTAASARAPVFGHAPSLLRRIPGVLPLQVWQAAFGPTLQAVPLGIGGSTIEELSYLLMSGEERFALDPRCE